jgi:RNA polymerase sigma factor (sigma-70 family)
MPASATGASDLALVRGALDRDREAVDELGRRLCCVELILGSQNARLGRPLHAAEIQDLAQDTVLLIWSKLPSFEGLATLETWLYRFCVLELMNALRRKRREQGGVELDLELPRPESARSLVDVERLETALGRLSAVQAEVIRRRHFDELEFDQIAAHLSMPINTVRSHYRRGIRELQQLLAGRLEQLR